MQLQLEEKDVEWLYREGKVIVRVRAFWKKPDGSLFALGSGDVSLELMENKTDDLLKSFKK